MKRNWKVNQVFLAHSGPLRSDCPCEQIHIRAESVFPQRCTSHISDMFMNSVELISIKCPTHGTLTAQSLHFSDFFSLNMKCPLFLHQDDGWRERGGGGAGVPRADGGRRRESNSFWTQGSTKLSFSFSGACLMHRGLVSSRQLALWFSFWHIWGLGW